MKAAFASKIAFTDLFVPQANQSNTVLLDDQICWEAHSPIARPARGWSGDWPDSTGNK